MANLTPGPRHGHRLGLPLPGRRTELVNTDSLRYGGSDIGNLGGVETEDVPWMNQYHSAELSLPRSRRCGSCRRTDSDGIRGRALATRARRERFLLPSAVAEALHLDQAVQRAARSPQRNARRATARPPTRESVSGIVPAMPLCASIDVKVNT